MVFEWQRQRGFLLKFKLYQIQILLPLLFLPNIHNSRCACSLYHQTQALRLYQKSFVPLRLCHLCLLSASSIFDFTIKIRMLA
jgi:hypothetical protein